MRRMALVVVGVLSVLLVRRLGGWLLDIATAEDPYPREEEDDEHDT